MSSDQLLAGCACLDNETAMLRRTATAPAIPTEHHQLRGLASCPSRHRAGTGIKRHAVRSLALALCLRSHFQCSCEPRRFGAQHSDDRQTAGTPLAALCDSAVRKGAVVLPHSAVERMMRNSVLIRTSPCVPAASGPTWVTGITVGSRKSSHRIRRSAFSTPSIFNMEPGLWRGWCRRGSRLPQSWMRCAAPPGRRRLVLSRSFSGGALEEMRVRASSTLAALSHGADWIAAIRASGWDCESWPQWCAEPAFPPD